MTGLEELLGSITGWIGFDLRNKSLAGIIFVVAFWTLLGLALLIGGIRYLLGHLDDGAGIISGAFLAVLGAAFLARIAVNLSALLRQ